MSVSCRSPESSILAAEGSDGQFIGAAGYFNRERQVNPIAALVGPGPKVENFGETQEREAPNCALLYMSGATRQVGSVDGC